MSVLFLIYFFAQESLPVYCGTLEWLLECLGPKAYERSQVAPKKPQVYPTPA